MTIERDPDRLVLFTDAVTAIAVTLLILPLVDVVGESRAEGLTAVQVVTEHTSQIWTFLLSFVVIARFWLVHHRLFTHVRAYSTTLMWLNFGWLLVVVVLPFPTEIIGAYPSGRFTSGLYIATILVLALFQTALAFAIHRDPAVENADDPVTQRELRASVVASGLFAVAFLLAVLIPGVDFYALFVVFLAPVIGRGRARFAR
ncbi:TMEM175 family protein [Xylanimonas sp. McL0601]|uniref:TMEM175 family protein n=1 Tax=Xylanimonas sp. McL0601 TaxID=3414739 RepID=UPI003CE6A3C3